MRRWLAIALLLTSVGACSDEASSPQVERQPVEVLSAKVQPSGELTVAVDACQGDPEVQVEESDEVVRVVATVVVPGPACADGVTVPLDRPLGERRLVDSHTGETIEVIRVEEG